MALVAISSVLPSIDAALSQGPRDHVLVKQLVGGVGMAMMAGSVLAGFLADRIGIRTLLTLSVLAYILSGTAGLYVSDLPYLLASRVVLGLSAAMIQITAFTLINTRLAPAARAQWMGKIEAQGGQIARLRPRLVIETFKRWTARELDLPREAASASELAQMMEAEPQYHVPAHDWQCKIGRASGRERLCQDV